MSTGCPSGCDDFMGQCICPPTPTPTTTSAPTPPNPTPTGCGSPEFATDEDCEDENNNAGCNWDGGACCGDNVSTDYCTECKCLDPNFGA